MVFTYLTLLDFIKLYSNGNVSDYISTTSNENSISINLLLQNCLTLTNLITVKSFLFVVSFALSCISMSLRPFYAVLLAIWFSHFLNFSFICILFPLWLEVCLFSLNITCTQSIPILIALIFLLYLPNLQILT